MVLASIPGHETHLPNSILRLATLISRPIQVHSLLRACLQQPDKDIVVPTEFKRLQGLRILAVEDNMVNQVVLDEILDRQEGASVTLANDGIEALTVLQEMGFKAFDVVITDIQMPNMNGYELAQRIRELKPDFPVIALTANSMADEREHCLAAGMIDYLTKPIDILQLVALLQPYIQNRSQLSQPIAPLTVQTALSDVNSLIDWQALNERFDYRQSFITKLISTVLTSINAMPEKLVVASSAQDYQTLMAMAHTLKGIGGNIKAQTVHSLAAATETAAKNQDSNCLELAMELTNLTQRLINELNASAIGS